MERRQTAATTYHGPGGDKSAAPADYLAGRRSAGDAGHKEAAVGQYLTGQIAAGPDHRRAIRWDTAGRGREGEREGREGEREGEGGREGGREFAP